jgi:hypothetical protein
VTRILLFICCFPFWLYGQLEVAAIHYDTENGLESNTIYSIQQDNLGHLLLAHEKGVSIFNGKVFQTPMIPGGSIALSNLTPFDQNQFICRSFSGKSYRYTAQTIQEFSTPNTVAGGYPTFLTDQNKVYAYHGDLFYEVLKKGQIQVYSLKNFPKSFRFRLAHVDHGYLHAVITEKNKIRFIIYDLKNEQIIQTKEISEEQEFDVYGGPYNYILVHRTQRYFERFNLSNSLTNTIHPEGINPQSKITFIEKNTYGNILIGTFDGLLIYDQQFKLIHHVLKGQQISSYLEDREHKHWIGTLQNGLYQIPSFNIHLFKASEISGRNVKLSKALMLENGKMVIGTFDGRVVVLNQHGNIEKIINLHKTAEIQSLYQIDENQILVYCEQLLTLDLKKGNILSSYPITATKCIAKRENKWVFGTSKGIHFKDSKEKQLLDSLWVKQVHFLSSDTLLLATSKGLKLYQISTKKLENIYPFGSQIARDLVKLKERYYFRIENTIYAFLNVNKYEKIQTYSEEIQSLFTDGLGLVVLTKKNELHSLFHPQQFQINNFKGLILKEVISLFNRKGTFILFNQNGIQYFNHFLPTNLNTPYLNITKIQGSYKEGDNLWNSTYSNNWFEIELELLPNLSAQGKGVVQYRLQGLQNEWTNINSNQYAYNLKLDRLPFGNYQLELRGINEDGIYSKIKNIKLHVSVPYYFSIWFICGEIIGLAILVWFIIRLKTNYLTRKNEAKLEKERLKIKTIKAELAAIRSQMNPHFIFNSLSSIQSQILNESSLEAYQNLSTFAKLMRKALHYSSKEFINLKEELEFIDHYVSLELLRINQGFQYQKSIDPNLNLEQIYLPSLLLQPFVENAIRHGIQHSLGEKSLEIKVSKLKNGVEIKITDNGIGREKSAELNAKHRKDHESFATQAIHDRIEMLKELQKMEVSIEIIDLDQGTSVVINILYPPQSK